VLHWTRCREIRHPGDELAPAATSTKTAQMRNFDRSEDGAGWWQYVMPNSPRVYGQPDSRNGGKSINYCPTGNIKSCSHWCRQERKEIPVSCLEQQNRQHLPHTDFRKDAFYIHYRCRPLRVEGRSCLVRAGRLERRMFSAVVVFLNRNRRFDAGCGS